MSDTRISQTLTAEMLDTFEIFRGLTRAQLAAVAGIGTTREVAAGQDIIAEREPAEALFVIRSGLVQICLEAGLDSTVAVSTLGSGKALGWSAVLGRQAYSGTARTVEPSSLIAIPAAPLRRMMLEDKALAVALLTAIGRMTAARLDDTRYQLVGVMGHPGEPGDAAPAG